LHAELCGTKYTDSISHTQKLSDFLDKINSALISDMSIDCVCCDSVDISSLDLFNLFNNKLLPKNFTNTQKHLYVSSIKKQTSITVKVRAPPNS